MNFVANIFFFLISDRMKFVFNTKYLRNTSSGWLVDVCYFESLKRHFGENPFYKFTVNNKNKSLKKTE